MSKIKQLFVAAMLAMPLLVTVPVSAVDGDCTISNTGPGSNNQCTTEDNYTCEVQIDNTVVVYNNNEQVAQSGNASGTGNTTGGSATSGSVTNSNGTTIDYTIENGDCEVADVTEAVVTEESKSQTPVTANGNGMGAVEAKPTVLANTGAIEVAPVALALIATAVVTVLGVGTYAALVSRR